MHEMLSKRFRNYYTLRQTWPIFGALIAIMLDIRLLVLV